MTNDELKSKYGNRTRHVISGTGTHVAWVEDVGGSMAFGRDAKEAIQAAQREAARLEAGR